MLVMFDTSHPMSNDFSHAFATQEGGEDAVTSITFSANGYHLATGHQSAAVKFWDLRKQKVIATMNEDASVLSSVASISFDDSAKFAAIGGEGGLIITTVKEWGTTCKIATNKPVSGLEWTKVGIASTSDKERAISFHGSP
jgi:WD40 repeat protein